MGSTEIGCVAGWGAAGTSITSGEVIVWLKSLSSPSTPNGGILATSFFWEHPMASAETKKTSAANLKIVI
jgi:hypothetical protein